MKKTEPFFTKSKFDCECAETNKPIKKGETILFDPVTKKAYYEYSPSANHIRNQYKQLAEQLLNPQKVA